MSDLPPPVVPPAGPPSASPPWIPSPSSSARRAPSSWDERNAGHVPANQASGLRTATTVLFWCATAAMALVAAAAVNRRVVFNDFIDANASFADLDDADSVIGGAVVICAALLIAGTIVLAVWSNRTANLARAHGADVSPGLTTGGWFVPIGYLFVSFHQLRKIARLRRRATAALGMWQGWFVAAWVAIAVFRGFGGFDVGDDVDQVRTSLTVQVVSSIVAALCLAVAAIFARRAMRDIDGI